MKKITGWISGAIVSIVAVVLMIMGGSTFKVLTERYPLVTFLIAVVIVIVIIYANKKDKGVESENGETEPEKIDTSSELKDDRHINHPVKTDKQVVDLYAQAVDKPANDSPNESMDRRLKKTLIISAVILLSLTVIMMLVYPLQGHRQNVIVNELFEVSVPSNWDVEQSDAGGMGRSVTISCDDELLNLVCFSEAMGIETAMEYSQLLRHSDDKAFRGASYGDAYDATVASYPARQMVITNSVDNKDYKGRLSIVTARSKTMIIMDFHDAQIEPKADEILSTLKFNKTPANPESVNARMKTLVKSMSSKLPQQVDELTVYQSVKIVDKALVHTYTINEDLNLNKQELESFCVQMKSDQCELLVKLNSSLTMEWLNEGCFITYKYNDKQNNELIQFTISKDDLN